MVWPARRIAGFDRYLYGVATKLDNFTFAGFGRRRPNDRTAGAANRGFAIGDDRSGHGHAPTDQH